jgi:hypothetical protein
MNTLSAELLLLLELWKLIMFARCSLASVYENLYALCLLYLLFLVRLLFALASYCMQN